MFIKTEVLTTEIQHLTINWIRKDIAGEIFWQSAFGFSYDFTEIHASDGGHWEKTDVGESYIRCEKPELETLYQQIKFEESL